MANWEASSTFTALTTRPQPSGPDGWPMVTRFSFGDLLPSSNSTIRSTDPGDDGVPVHQCTELD